MHATTVGNVMEFNRDIYPALGIITPGNNTGKIVASGSGSSLSLLDQRIYLEVSTDLPIARRLKLVGTNENTDVSICRVPFTNELRSTILCEEGSIKSDYSFSLQGYVGNHSFIKKTDQLHDWNVLKTSYNLRVFRFRLWCVYNQWNGTDFALYSKRVDVGPDSFWNLGLRFVSKIQ